MRFLLLLPADHGCESPAVVRPLAFGPVGFFLPGLAGLESLTKRMEAAQRGLQQGGDEMNQREMDLEDLITSRSGDVLRLKAKADAAMPEMAKVWRDEARRAASDVARLVALREPATVARMEAERGLS